MKQTYFLVTILIFVFSFTLIAQEDIDIPGSQKQKDAQTKVDTRIDNMGYWKKMAAQGKVPYSPVIPFKPAEIKGSDITINGVKVADSPDVPVTSATNVTESENSVFVDPNDNQYVLNSNNSTSWTGSSVGSLYGANYFQTNNGGSSWFGSASGAGGANSGDPTTAINLSGRQFVNYISSSSGQGIAYSDDGSSWTTATVGPNPGSLADKNHMWIDNAPTSPYVGNLYAAWTDFGGTYDSEIVFSRSTNNGPTWSSRINLSAASAAGSHNQGVNIQTGPNGEVYVVWAIYDSWPSDESRYAMAKSTNGGASFGSSYNIITNTRGIRSTEVPQNMRVNSFPSMAVDIGTGPYSGNIYVVWTNIGTPGVNSGTAGIYMIRSTNGGTSWSTPVKVNQGSGTAYQPWITCDPETGTIAVVFYDNRNTATADAEAWVSYSTDAGSNWTDFRVSDVSFTPTPIPGLAASYMGDYLGITAKGGRFYPCWTDNRGSTYMTYVSPFELGLNADFTADATNICTGSTVTFTDASTGPPATYSWSFPGGTPSSASGAGPHTVTYSGSGTYNVSLTVTDGGSGSDTETKTGYITVQNVIADFSASQTTVVAGNTVTFTDNSACGPTSWNWTFPGGTPGTATGIGPHTITYNTVGTYNVSLAVTSGGNNDTETKTNYIDVINCNYCSTSYSNTADDYISNVSFNTINNASGSTNYSDFTTISTNVTTGNTYSFAMNITVNGNWVQHGWVWFDWNRDCDFDDPGEGFDLGQTPGSTGTFTLSSNILVPAGASLGSTRMRVAEKYNGDPSQCEVTTYGEAEDYTIVLQSGAVEPVADFSADDLTPAIGQTVNFTDLSSNGPTSWLWNITPATHTYTGGTNSNSQNPQVQFNTGGYYTVTLVATNGIGSDFETKTNYILAGTAGNWTGATSTTWSLGSNWENLSIPASGDDVIIPATVPNFPVFTGDFELGVQCNDITLMGNSTFGVTGDLTIPAGRSLTCSGTNDITVGGDWNNMGTFIPGSGTVEFNGSGSSVITGASGSASTILITECNQNSPDFIEIQNVSSSSVDASNLLVAVSASYTDINSVNTTYWNLGTLAAGQVQYRDDQSGSGQYWGSNIFWSSGNNGWAMIINNSTGAVVDFLAWGWTSAQIAGMNPTINGHSVSIGAEWTGNGTNSTCSNSLFRLGSSDNNDATDFTCQTASPGVQNAGLTVPFPGGSFAFYNLFINKSNALATLNSDMDVLGNMTIGTQAQFTNASGNTIAVSGDLLIQGTSTGKGSYIDNGTLTVAGTTTVQKYYTDTRWHYITSPVTNAISNNFFDMYLYYWLEDSYTWFNVVATDSLLRVGKGYGLWSTLSNPTIEFDGGSLNTGNISIPVQATDTDGGGIGATEGYNLIGNPYPSAIDLGAPGNALPGYTWTNIGTTVYMNNGSQYATYNPNTGISTNGATRYVPSMQGFFVKADDFNPVLVIPNSARLHSTQDNYKASVDFQMLKLLTQGNGYSDEVIIAAIEDASFGFDSKYDAYKMMGKDEAPQLYCIYPDMELSVNTLDEITEATVIPLGIKTGVAGTYSISISEIEAFDAYPYIVLEDLETNTFVNLKETNYQFSSIPDATAHRFNLHFKDVGVGMIENSFNEIFVYSHKDVIYIESDAEFSGDIHVFDMMGQEVSSKNAEQSTRISIPINNGIGYYLVQVQSDKGLKTQKVFIK
jgi:PKD repeat protein